MELGMLLTAAARSTESAFLLIANGQLWDAEVVLRSVFEASLKFAFIVQTPNDFRQRFHEYTVDMFELSIMKDDQKAREVLAAAKDPAAPEWRALRDLVLPDGQREQLRARFDKGTRRSMETRWGYAALLDALSRDDPIYKNASGMSHGYAIASHIHHADYVGVSIPLDRDMRPPSRRDSAHMAHLARLISDCFTCCLIRLVAGHRFAGIGLEALDEALRRVDEIRAVMSSAHKHWLDAEYGYAPKD